MTNANNIDTNLLSQLNSIGLKQNTSNFEATLFQDYSSLPTMEDIRKYRESLPIFHKKKELMQLIQENQVVIVIGETGSGKTTQLPQYLEEEGYWLDGKIACTQLRRVAAKAMAYRVAIEMGGQDVGNKVGYSVRFDEKISLITRIQYMTDGILIRECIYDKLLHNYSVIMLDESHERNLNTDTLLAILKYIITQRDNLKIIISSATLDAKKFQEYFNNAPVFYVSGRMFPVEIEYVYDKQCSYILQASRIVKRINELQGDGDILVFMTGKDEIENLIEELENYGEHTYNGAQLGKKLTLLPIFANLPSEEQLLIFKPAQPGYRKVIIATNIAENSLTVNGIFFVVDCGYVKQKVYDPIKKNETLVKVRVSQAQAIQRAGRAGRVGAGKCYRLYSEDVWNEELVRDTNPEILRSNLRDIVLMLKKIGFANIFELEFIDSPSRDALEEAERELMFYNAIDSRGHMTEDGENLVSFPIDLNLAKMIIASQKLGCTSEILTIVSMLSVSTNIFYRPKKKLIEATAAHRMFLSVDGDLIRYMRIFNTYRSMENQEEWCKENFVDYTALQEAENIRRMLQDILRKKNMQITSSGTNFVPVRMSICAALYQNVAKKVSTNPRDFKYQLMDNPEEEFFIHPSSCTFKMQQPWVVYLRTHSDTTFVRKKPKAYLLDVTPISTEWIRDCSPQMYSKILQ